MATDPNAPTNFVDRSDNVGTLSEKAERCRRLAAGISDRQAAEVLRKMATNYEESAARLTRD